MRNKTIRIGTRGSALSLTQTNIVKDLLQQLVPDTKIEILTIKTTGDKNMNPIPLDTIGKGWFTKEIDRKLLNREIDLAVHSLKDLLDTLTPGLVISAIPKREDASEALVARNNESLKQLKKGAVVGTDSIRRKMQLLKIRPDLVIKSVRGNVNRRLEKLDAGEYDAIVLAVAGLRRLGFETRITEYFSPLDIIPSPGQGALAIVTNKKNKKLNQILSKLNHKPSVVTVTAEREFSRMTNGGCSMPVGAYAKINGQKLTLYGMLGSLDEKHMLRGSMTGRIDNPTDLGKKLAVKLMREAKWMSSKYIVLTRDKVGNISLAKKLQLLGMSSLSCPGIEIKSINDNKMLKTTLTSLDTFDWILFTSSNGVKFFMKYEPDQAVLQKIKIAVVGSKTARTAQNAGLQVSVIPKTFTAQDLLKAMPSLKRKKILLARSDIADPKIKTLLEEKSAVVTDIAVYKTTLTKRLHQEFIQAIKNNAISYLTFTSPSTVRGFLKNIVQSDLPNVLSLPVLSIGPVTTKEAQKYGFTNIITSDVHTIDGMISALQRANSL